MSAGMIGVFFGEVIFAIIVLWLALAGISKFGKFKGLREKIIILGLLAIPYMMWATRYPKPSDGSEGGYFDITGTLAAVAFIIFAEWWQERKLANKAKTKQ